MALKYFNIIFLFLFLFYCNPSIEIYKTKILKNNTTYYTEIRSADSVVIYWSNGGAPIDTTYYELFYKTVSILNYALLKDSIPFTQNPVVTIYRSELPSADSIFYFAIRSINKYGVSPFHFSTDTTAIPETGWFLLWKH